MKKILVIDDDVDVIDLVDYILIANGFKVIESQKMLAIEEIIQLNPNLIIVDYLVKSNYGERLCLQLKANELTKHIPIILFSTHSELASVAERTCPDAYIEKPFDLRVFEETVESLAL